MKPTSSLQLTRCIIVLISESHIMIQANSLLVHGDARFLFSVSTCGLIIKGSIFSCFHLLSLLTLNAVVDFAPPQSHIISVRKCVFTREGGSEWRCWCIEQSCLSLLKAFVSWGSLFITKPLVARDIKTGSDPGVSPLTSVNPRGQIFSNCAITISWPQGLWWKKAGARQNEWTDMVGKSGNL